MHLYADLILNYDCLLRKLHQAGLTFHEIEIESFYIKSAIYGFQNKFYDM